MLTCTINDQANIKYLFLIDSGADKTVIPFELASRLNLFKYFIRRDFTTGVEGKKIISYFCQLEKLTILHNNKPFFEFKNVEIQITLSNLKMPSFGRDFLFKKFKITFIEKRKESILEKN